MKDLIQEFQKSSKEFKDIIDKFPKDIIEEQRIIMSNILKLLFIRFCFVLNIIKIPTIKPDNTTLDVLNLLRRIYLEAEKRSIKVWLTGSWAITGRNGGYIKQIRDIDFTMRTREDEIKFEQVLKDLGLSKKENSPMGANRYIDAKSEAEVDFGSITYPRTIYYNIQLDEQEKVDIDGSKFRVIPKESQIKLYKSILFSKGRNVKNDLVKLLILTKDAKG